MDDLKVAAEPCVALGASQPRLEAYPGREISLAGLSVTRVLPIKGRRLIGPWCFLDRYGPVSFSGNRPMDVAAHPHTGLQTVSWLLDGEIQHDDSLGFESVLRPRGVNVMTAGHGIAHAEQTPTTNTGRLNGVQLWVALPDRDRHMASSFQHIEQVPADERRGGIIQVFAGNLDGLTSPANHLSTIIGADLQVHPAAALSLPLQNTYEHAVIVLSGNCEIDGQPLAERVLYYLGAGRGEVTLSSKTGGRVLLIGGPPFPETILMWWNFVARTPQEIADARRDWELGQRFGDVANYDGPRLDAPDLGRLATPNPAS